MNPCEWNPHLQKPSQKPPRATDCDNPAAWSVGTGKRNIHLCEQCARRIEFRRLRHRVRLSAFVPPKAAPEEVDHDGYGNCWDINRHCPECGDGQCDVCHEHEQPRGECDECPQCPECDAPEQVKR